MFKKIVEDFKCENCGYSVIGNGFTNHCPDCLWSKHVDNDPGDRANTCCGLMEPVGIEGKSNAPIIVHRCVDCGDRKRNKSAYNDDYDKLAIVATGK